MQEGPLAQLSPPQAAFIRQCIATGEEAGYQRPLGPAHHAFYHAGGARLLVSFELLPVLVDEQERSTLLGRELAEGTGCSHLAILAHRADWFRSSDVHAFFDELTDEGFFDEFDQVVFYGAGIGGYAAAACSVAAPGATVIVISPQATLDPRIAEWDPRFISARRLSFTDRYGYAPEMLDAAQRAFLFYDPEEEFDAMHAALFHRPHVERIRLRHLGRAPEPHLMEMDILRPMIHSALQGRLSLHEIHRLWRARQQYPFYLRRLMAHLEDEDRLLLAQRLCRFVRSRLDGPCFPETQSRIEKLIEKRLGREVGGEIGFS